MPTSIAGQQTSLDDQICNDQGKGAGNGPNGQTTTTTKRYYLQIQPTKEGCYNVMIPYIGPVLRKWLLVLSVSFRHLFSSPSLISSSVGGSGHFGYSVKQTLCECECSFSVVYAIALA